MTSSPHPPPRSKRLVIAGVALVIVAAAIVVTLMLVHRHKVAKTREARSRELAKGPVLVVTKVVTSRAQRELSLPGEVRGYNQATLYAKVSGYVKTLKVDRGDHVKAGDVMAIIESPETQDDVLSALSNRDFTKRASQRYDALLVEGLASKLDRDNAANAAQRADADLRRARSLLEYTQVRAPFDGVVTARYVDPGALVPAATSATQQAQPVVDVADIDRVRIFVYPGQDAASFVKSGDPLTIADDERPSMRIPAFVTRATGALDPRTRTMQCEIELDNRQWHLLPGTFVHVRLRVDIPPSAAVPNDALVTRDGKPHVAVIEQDKVHYRPVEVGTNDGVTTRILSGLSGGETVGLNVPVELDEDDTVQPLDKKQKGANAGGADTKDTPAGSPTSTPTSEAPPPQPGPPGVREDRSQPNITPDNLGDGGAKH